MQLILVLIAKDFALLSRSKLAVIVTFLMPLALVYGISTIYGLTGHKAGPSGIPVALINESSSPAATIFVGILQSVKVFRLVTEVPGEKGAAKPVAETDLAALMKEGKVRFAVVIPPDFQGKAPFRLNARLVMNSRDEVENQVVGSVLEGTMTASVPSILIKNLQPGAVAEGDKIAPGRRLAYSLADTYGGDPEEIHTRLQAADIVYLAKLTTPTTPVNPNAPQPRRAGPFVHIEVAQTLGNDVKSPQATNLIGGWAIQFLLVAVSGSAAGLFAEKNLGIFQRLLAGPVQRSTLLWSKFLYGVALGVVQLLVLFIAGHFIVGFEIAPYLGSLTLVCLFAAAACSAFGLLIASVSRTLEAATGIASVSTMLMCAIGGVWFPPSFMPAFIQKIAGLSLVYWTNQGFAQVLWAHASLWTLASTLAVLGSIVAVLMTIALWQFKRSNIFR